MTATATRKTTKTADKPVKQQQMIYRIEVQRSGDWHPRKLVAATSPNSALRVYGVRGTRPRLGHAWSKSGKQFRAINTGHTSLRAAQKNAK